MPDSTSDEDLKSILRETRTIAAVGVSTNPVRPSYFVARYLHYRGYRVIPINPVAKGGVLFGEQILGDMSEIPDGTVVDMLEIFRRAEFVPEVLDEGLRYLRPGLKTVWMQFGIWNEDAATRARSEGLRVVQDRCPKVEFQRLFGELRKMGINTGIVSSKLPEWV